MQNEATEKDNFKKRSTIVGKIAQHFERQQSQVDMEQTVSTNLLDPNDKSVLIMDEKRESKVSLFLAMKDAQITKSKIAGLGMKEQLQLTQALLKPVDKTKAKPVSQKVLDVINKQKNEEEEKRKKNSAIMNLTNQISAAINSKS